MFRLGEMKKFSPCHVVLPIRTLTFPLNNKQALSVFSHVSICFRFRLVITISLTLYLLMVYMPARSAEIILLANLILRGPL